MLRRFRGAVYDIRVSRRPGRGPRRVRIKVNGDPLKGTVVAPARPGARVRVDVELVPVR